MITPDREQAPDTSNLVFDGQPDCARELSHDEAAQLFERHRWEPHLDGLYEELRQTGTRLPEGTTKPPLRQETSSALKFLQTAAEVAHDQEDPRQLVAALVGVIERNHSRSRQATVMSKKVVGLVTAIEPIPEATSSRLAHVYIGDDASGKPDIKTIMCGGSDTVCAGDHVVVALPGARIQRPDGTTKKLRAANFNFPAANGTRKTVKSQGMLCSWTEADVTEPSYVMRDSVLRLPPGLTPGTALGKVALAPGGTIAKAPNAKTQLIGMYYY